MIEHPRSRNSYLRRSQASIFEAVVKLRASGYRVYRDDDRHRIWLPKVGNVATMTDAELMRFAGIA